MTDSFSFYPFSILTGEAPIVSSSSSSSRVSLSIQQQDRDKEDFSSDLFCHHQGLTGHTTTTKYV